MNKRSLVLTLTASAVLALGLRVLVFPDRAEPAEHLVKLQARAQEPGVDPALMVREITRVLEDPRTIEDTETHAALLWLRAEVHAGARHYPAARADLEQQAVVLGEATTTIVLRTAELEALEGRTMDAYTRVKGLLDLDEDLYAGWQLAGRLERRLAHETRAEALDTANALLLRTSRERAVEVIEELCARESQDPRRLQLASELADLYLPSSPDPLARAIDLASDAADYHAAARASLARSLAGGPDGPTVAALIELLHEAGQAEFAVELGITAYAEGAEPADVFEALLDAMLDAGQLERFAERVRKFPWRPTEATPELCLRVLELLFTSGAWIDPKTRASMSGPIRCLRVLNRPDTDSALNLYSGLSSYASAVTLEDEERSRELYDKAIVSLERFIVSAVRIDPFPGASAVAHLYRSRAWRALGDERREREDLGRALTPSLDVDAEDWLSHVTGEEFLRHAELVLKLPQRGSRRPEEDWTQGMARLPHRAYELVERWSEIGQASLAETGHDLDRLFTNMRSAGSVTPAMDVGPWTRWRLAEMLLERNNLQGAIVAARRLIDSYPGLVLAHDILIESQLERGSRIQVIDDILARLELVGPDERHARYVEEVGLDSFAPNQLLRVMQLDPRGVGRSVVAPRMMSAGEPERALTALGPVQEGESASTTLLRAQALQALGQVELAEELYSSLLPDPAHGEAALEALVRIRLTKPNEQSLGAIADILMRRLAEDEVPRTDLALELIDRELERGNTVLASSLLEQLDARAVTRSGEVLWRIAIQRLLSGRHDEALEAFTRAEAFLPDERVALARIVLAIEGREWRSIAPQVAALRRTSYKPSPLVDAILTLLQERTDAGRELAVAGMMAEPHSSEWLLVQAAGQTLVDESFQVPAYFGRTTSEPTLRILRGTEQVLRDPREILGALLLLELPNTDLWIEDALQRLDPTSEELWTNYLLARAATRRGKWPLAEYQWRRLARAERRFGPAWDGLLETVLAQAPDLWDPAVLQVRVDRRDALGRNAGSSTLDEALDAAAGHVLSGDLESAIEVLTPAVAKADNRVTGARVLLARLDAALGRYEDADRVLAPLLPDARGSSDGYWLDAYVKWLAEGARPTVEPSQRLPLKKVLSRLETLEERFPKDPLFPLERARANLLQVASPAQAVGFTLRVLDAFRERSKNAAFNRLRPGSALAWGEFLLELSPLEAERFLLEELASNPGQVDLWSLLAKTLSAQGRDADTRELLRAVVQMSQDPLAVHDYAWALVENGAGASQIDAVLSAIPEGKDPYGPGRARFLRALSELQGARASLELAGQILATLWENPENLRGVDLSRLGRTYASVLLRRSSADDLEKLEGVLAGMNRFPRGPYASTVLDSLRGLATYRRATAGLRRVQVDRASDDATPAETPPPDDAPDDAPSDEADDEGLRVPRERRRAGEESAAPPTNPRRERARPEREGEDAAAERPNRARARQNAGDDPERPRAAEKGRRAEEAPAPKKDASKGAPPTGNGGAERPRRPRGEAGADTGRAGGKAAGGNEASKTRPAEKPRRRKPDPEAPKEGDAADEPPPRSGAEGDGVDAETGGPGHDATEPGADGARSSGA